MEARALLRLPIPPRSSPFRPLSRHCPSTSRRFTINARQLASSPTNGPPPPQPASSPTTSTSQTFKSLGGLGKKFERPTRTPGLSSLRSSPTRTGTGTYPGSTTPPPSDDPTSLSRYAEYHKTDNEHHLHIYSHKHNTHLTLTNEKRNPLISISTGNLGFRKAQRGTFDAAYQLGAYMLTRMQQQGYSANIVNLELVFRGFGQGRDAVTKVIMGVEGMGIREKVVRVVDKTRLKIGGTRSPKPRRLG